MVTRGSYICGEHRIMYILVKSLFYTPKTTVTLCVNHALIKIISKAYSKFCSIAILYY